MQVMINPRTEMGSRFWRFPSCDDDGLRVILGDRFNRSLGV